MTNLEQLFLLIVVMPCFGQTISNVVDGSLSGTLLGDDGSPVLGAYVTLHLRTPVIAERQPQKRQFGTNSGIRGAFRFDGLKAGSYGICIQATGTAWLDPCDWGLSVPQVAIGSGLMQPTVTVTLTRGAIVPIRIDDSGQLLGQHLGKTPGADLLIGISRLGQPFRPTSFVSEDGGGRNHQIVIPFGASVRLIVASSFFKFADTKGNAFTGLSNGAAITVAIGQQAQPIHVTVIGRR